MEKKELTFVNVLDSLNGIETRLTQYALLLKEKEVWKDYNISKEEIPLLSEKFAPLHGVSKEEYEEFLNELLLLKPEERPFYIIKKDLIPVVNALKEDADFIINTCNVPLAKKMLSLHELSDELLKAYDIMRANYKWNIHLHDVQLLLFAIHNNLRFVKEGFKLQGRINELCECENGTNKSQQEPNGKSTEQPPTRGQEEPEEQENELPTIRESEQEKEEEKKIFKKAIDKKYMILQDSKFSWQKKPDSLRAYLCARLFYGDRIIDSNPTNNDPNSSAHYKWQQGEGTLTDEEIKKLNDLFDSDIVGYIYTLRTRNQYNLTLRSKWRLIDELFNEENGSE